MRPSIKLLQALGLWSATAILPVFFPNTLNAWLIGSGIFFAIVIADAWSAWKQSRIQLVRVLPDVLPVGLSHKVVLRLRHFESRELSIQLCEIADEHAKLNGDSQSLCLEPGIQAELSYQLTPTQRGVLEFAACQLLVTSPMSLWQRSQRVATGQQVRVYPNFAAITEYAMLTLNHHVAQLGIRLQRRRGEGLEFQQLREYRSGDSLRQIDWKATSRYRKLISKDYQDERDQQVLFLVDCSRRMRTREDELAHFDHVLNAMLLLSWVAIRQGDAVGMQCFGGQDRSVAPKKGSDQINRLLDASYDLQPTIRSPDYLAVAEKVLMQQRRRALIVILTTTRDEDNDDLSSCINVLGRKHLILLANLREASLDQALDAEIVEADDAVGFLSAAQFKDQCDRALQQLGRLNALLVHETPKGLPPAIVNRYMEAKRAGRL